jgi:hypothetical protein
MKNKITFEERKDQIEWLLTFPDCPDSDREKMEEELRVINRNLHRRNSVKRFFINILFFPPSLFAALLLLLILIERRCSNRMSDYIVHFASVIVEAQSKVEAEAKAEKLIENSDIEIDLIEEN